MIAPSFDSNADNDNEKSPDIAIGAFCLTFRSNWVPGSVLLSHGECHTTIGATAFHFCVRHGYRWFHCAIAARQNLQSRKADVNNDLASLLCHYH